MTITLEKLNELKKQLEEALRNVENLICLAHYDMESDSTDTDYESECEDERYFPLPDELPPMPPTLVRQQAIYLEHPPSPKTPVMERYPPIDIDGEELPPPIVLPQPQKKYKKGNSSPI
jgi:hypothetical protein